uniref:Ig-like domain-containing protein n=1 Tax=Astyanax mexicanus TaxID=7994 RepID=A0A8B9H589_ASTMX
LLLLLLLLLLYQPELSWTKPEGKTLYIDCKVTDLGSGNNVHWYQQKDGEALRRILYINNGGTTKTLDPNHPEKDDFTMSEGTYKLKVKAVKKIHAAVYYCACWDGHSDNNYSHPVQELCLFVILSKEQ